MNTLISDVNRLRKNCLWHQALPFGTLRTYLTEEFQEALGALDNRDPNTLKEELGDLRFQFLLYSRMASERGCFSAQEIMDGLHHKIIYRNQNVLGGPVLANLEAVNLHWPSIKEHARNRNLERTNRKMYEIAI